MQLEPKRGQYMRELKLPSGRRINVVYVDSESPETSAPEQDLHVCTSCHCNFVYPIDWSPVGRTHWSVTLRCPNCEWSGTGVVDHDVVERFDVELDRGTMSLARELERVSLANMVEDIERFVTALNADHIVPFDF